MDTPVVVALIAASAALGGILTQGAGYLLRRYAFGQRKAERTTQLGAVIDMLAKMRAHDFSVEEVRQLEAALVQAPSAVVTRDANKAQEVRPARQEPQSYWSHRAMSARASSDLTVAEARLGSVLAELEGLLEGDELLALDKSQRAWRLLRAREAARSTLPLRGGRAEHMMYALAEAALTDQRSEELEREAERRRGR